MENVKLSETARARIAAALRDEKCVHLEGLGYIMISPPYTSHVILDPELEDVIGLSPITAEPPLMIGQTCTLAADIIFGDEVIACKGQDVWIEGITNNGYVVTYGDWEHSIGNISRDMLIAPDPEPDHEPTVGEVYGLGRDPRPRDEFGQPLLYESEKYYN